MDDVSYPMDIYIVQPEDTLEGIAGLYQVSASRLAYDNNIVNSQLVVGQALLILQPAVVYDVKEGDTLAQIASQYGVSVQKLLRNNSYLLNENYLVAGRTIVIEYEAVPFPDIDVFGYAYTYIEQARLQECCLYIQELLPFPYGFYPSGELIALDDDRLIETAFYFGKKTRMVITPLDANGIFNNQLVVLLLESVDLQNSLIQNIYTTMTEKGYTALDIDFEFIPGEYREEYVLFVKRVKNYLANSGYQVSVAVPPKISDEQPGLLYEGIDYQGLGTVADQIFLMTYEWGYKYGPPMAVAPIPSVRRVLDYAVTVIPREKLAMGIPNYAYDWPLPFVRNQTVATTIGNVDALRIAYEFRADIQYDETAQSPYFYYRDDGGVEHVVWFEDIRSMIAKYNLVQEYGFPSAGYWNLMREFRQNWLYVNVITDS